MSTTTNDLRTSDVQLSRDFWLSEVPHWRRYTDREVLELQKTVRSVIQPARREWGRIDLTSGLYWSSGEPRTGSHAHPGTVDFVPREATPTEVHDWIASRVAPTSWGQLILEFHKPHIHVVPWGLEVGGTPRYGEVLIEDRQVKGSFRFGRTSPAALLFVVVALAMLAMIFAFGGGGH